MTFKYEVLLFHDKIILFICFRILSRENNLITVRINGKSTSRRDCRIWVNTLNRKDGLYIVRYKLYETCYDMEISVAYKGAHAGGSPYKIKGKLYKCS